MKNIFKNFTTIRYLSFKENVKNLLQLPLPGEISQFKMAPSGVRNFSSPDKIINAAVLILIFPIDDIPHTVFMKRAEYPGIHSGQISLPGGREEAEDKNLEITALRETHEEIGVHPTNINLIGKLSPLFIPVSGYKVFPFVGFVDEKPVWMPDMNEVTYLIEVSIDELLNQSNLKKELKKINGYKIEVPYYSINGEKVWGATAMIISEFLDILKRIK